MTDVIRPFIDWVGGNCPVQGEGTIGDHRWFFRARGDKWTFEVEYEHNGQPQVWSYTERYGNWPDAGWMTEIEARSFINKAGAIYAKRDDWRGETL